MLAILSNLMPVSQPFTPEAAASANRFEHDRNLQAETDALLSLFDNMPPVPVYLKDEPILKSGTNTERGAAYTHCYSQELPTIFVKKIFYQKTNRKQLVNLLKHELTHAWLCRQRSMSSGHDASFRQKFTEVGGFGN
ncbi:MAG TPA: SprT-like domain-containing protein [Pyrinomonadaceae bacterium]